MSKYPDVPTTSVPYINSNADRFLDELFELIRIPSVSADSKFRDHVFEAAEHLKKSFENAGADEAEICATKGFPIVFAQKHIDASLPTVLVYGHYDVQPPDPLDLWETPPFEPAIRNGKIFARGACDDKGQMFMHVKAFETMMQTNSLPCNVKFVIEGEEEVGSDNLDIFVAENKDKLSADVVLISDTGIISLENPSVTVGLRGMAYMEVEVTGPNRDLHSGGYGGAVANPINVLCEMIASLKDENKKITIPGFYDKVAVVNGKEKEQLDQVPFDKKAYMKELDIEDLSGEKGYTPVEQISIRPTLDVNGIWGGYTGEGAKTVLPSKAHAKISMRLVPNQNSVEIAGLFKKHFESIAPKSVKVKVITHHGGEPAVVRTDSIGFEAASKAFEDAWGKKPIPTRDGGSIPVVSLFQRELGLDSILLGFGLDTDAIHSPNESYGVFNYFKGIETITYFYKNYAKLWAEKS